MKHLTHAMYYAACAVVVLFVTNTSALAQSGKLVLRVTPTQAHIFVDGRAIGEASKHKTIKLDAGEHKVEVVNYGFAPETRSVTITAKERSELEVSLVAIPGTVPGPFGAMTIENAQRDAVLLNGKEPDFFVGHGDEFNHEWWWKQELVVPPGTYQVTVLHEDHEVWSGAVDVAADQRVVIDVPKGVRKTVPWPRGEKFQSVPRFKVGSASATVAVAKPTAELSAVAAQINCGDSSKLTWGSTDAGRVEINPVGSVAKSGEQAVTPKQTTTYQLTAIGPGGTATTSATVNVNTAVQADLGLTPAEVRYKRVGNKVVEQGSTSLNWTAANASNISIDPLGTVDANGNRSLQIAPKKTDSGAVDETVTYTLTASNICGGTETKTATLRIVGSIESPDLFIRSVFFPTDRPRTTTSSDALLPSEQESLTALAAEFKQYLSDQPDARVVLIGHADERGPQAYNQSLSERRAQLTKQFLVEQGVPEANIETQAFGKERNLTADEVKQLLEQNSKLSEEERQKLLQRSETIVLAHNRRVDINLAPGGQESLREYPLQAADSDQLIDRNGPNKTSPVELAAQKEKLPN